MRVDTTLRSRTLLEFDEVTFDRLASRADKVYAAGAAVTATAPAVTTDPLTGLPVCDETALDNWGAPTDRLHVCFNYFPTIYGEGDLELSGSSSGQGTFVVDGNLLMKGASRVYGLVLVRGHLVVEGKGGGQEPRLVGGAVVAGQTRAGDAITNSRVAGRAEIRYSSCAVTRAKRFGQLAKVEPLPLRAWTEAF